MNVAHGGSVSCLFTVLLRGPLPTFRGSLRWSTKALIPSLTTSLPCIYNNDHFVLRFAVRRYDRGRLPQTNKNITTLQLDSLNSCSSTET